MNPKQLDIPQDLSQFLHELRDGAEAERREMKRPWIMCRRPGCDRQAIEGAYFCGDACWECWVHIRRTER